MSKQTTAQVAKGMDITSQQIHTILRDYPQLRPGEQGGPVVHYLYLWSEAEITALHAHIIAHPRIKLRKHARGL
jgi:hypothetical protein